MKRVVITGVGPITSVGIGKEKFWAAITESEKRSGIGPVSTFDPSIFRAASAAEVSDWKPEEFFPPHRLKRLDRYAQFAVASVKLALGDSGLQYSPDDPQERVGVSFGTAYGDVRMWRFVKLAKAGKLFESGSTVRTGCRPVNGSKRTRDIRNLSVGVAMDLVTPIIVIPIRGRLLLPEPSFCWKT